MKQFLLAVLLLLPLSAAAATFQTGDTIEVLGEGNAYAIGNVVQVSGEAPGDAYLAGETVQVNASIRENAVLLGQNVTVNAPIGDDLHAFGMTVILNEDVSGDAILFGQKVVIAPDARVGGSAVLGGQNVVSQGTFDRDVRMMGVDLTVGGTYGGDVKLHVGESLKIGDSAIIGGDLHLSLAEDASVIIPDGVVKGEVRKEFVSRSVERAPPLLGGLKLLSLLSRLLIGGALIAIARNFACRFAPGAKGGKRSWTLLGIGFLTAVLPPILAMLLFLPVVTIPVALLVFVFWGTILYLGTLLSGLLVANLLFPLQKTDTLITMIGKFALGTLTIALLPLIPLIGPAIVFLFTLLSIGVLVSYEVAAMKVLKRARLV